METAPSISRLAAIQGVEGKQDLADLAPKDGFIPAEPVERQVGQIGEAQKAAREVSGGVDRFRAGAGHGFRFGCNAVRCPIGVGVDRVSPSEHRVDYFNCAAGRFGGDSRSALELTGKDGGPVRQDITVEQLG
jgi:hypothetical protein